MAERSAAARGVLSSVNCSRRTDVGAARFVFWGGQNPCSETKTSTAGRKMRAVEEWHTAWLTRESLAECCADGDQIGAGGTSTRLTDVNLTKVESWKSDFAATLVTAKVGA